MKTTGVGIRTILDRRDRAVRGGKGREKTTPNAPYRPFPPPLTPCRVMLRALKREKLVNRANRGRVAARDSHFPAPRAIERHVADGRATVAHHSGAGHGLRVHPEW